MKKLLSAAAVALCFTAGSAQAALVSVPFTYAISFVDPTVAGELAFAPSDLFSGSVVYDDASAPDALGVYSATAFSLNFGSFSFNETNDISGFGVGVGVGPTNNLTALYFETLFNLVQGSGAGEYLLSFAGTNALLTPSGDTFDYKVTASAVPLPAALPLLAAGLGVMGFVGRRRRQAHF